MRLRNRFLVLRARLRLLLEPRWCRERHNETLEALRECAVALNDERQIRKLAEQTLAEGRRDVLDTMDRFIRAMKEQGVRVASVQIPSWEYDAWRREIRHAVHRYGASVANSPDLTLLGVRIDYRPDLGPGAFVVVPCKQTS